jgi:hypothetical protein
MVFALALAATCLLLLTYNLYVSGDFSMEAYMWAILAAGLMYAAAVVVGWWQDRRKKLNNR